MSINNIIWYYFDDTDWIKLEYRHDLSALDDVFEFLEDVETKRIKKGQTMSMYYGLMNEYIVDGRLMSEEQYKSKFDK